MRQALELIAKRKPLVIAMGPSPARALPGRDPGQWIMQGRAR